MRCSLDDILHILLMHHWWLYSSFVRFLYTQFSTLLGKLTRPRTSLYLYIYLSIYLFTYIYLRVPGSCWLKVWNVMETKLVCEPENIYCVYRESRQSIFSRPLQYTFGYCRNMLSVVRRLSVCLSVTRMYSEKTAAVKIMQFSLQCSPMP